MVTPRLEFEGDFRQSVCYTWGMDGRLSGMILSNAQDRFSTKYYDAETDLYYYGYRYYSPSLGRWISRDPIEEEGGVNLYNCNYNGKFVGYHAESSIDGNVPHDGYPNVRASDYLTKYAHVCFDEGNIFIVLLGMNDAIRMSRK